MEGWQLLRGAFKLPDLETRLGQGDHYSFDAWYESLKGFRREVWLDAVQNYIDHERYTPVPAVLREYCFNSSRKLRAEERKREAIRHPGEFCKWCGGSGWIWVEEDGKWPYVFNCVCGASRDPETGQRILDQAQADDTYVFCPEDYTFRPRETWIGDVTPEQEAMIETAFAEGRVGELI